LLKKCGKIGAPLLTLRYVGFCRDYLGCFGGVNMRLSSYRTVTLLAVLGSTAAQAELCTPQAAPAPALGAEVRLSLGKTGDNLTGRFQGCADDQARIEHPVLGMITVPGSTIAGVRLLTQPCAPELEQPGDYLAVRMAGSGDLVAGESLGCTAGVLRLKTEALGTLSLPTAELASVEVVPAGEPSIAGTDLAAVTEAPPPLWSSEVSLGLDGATGNTQRGSVRFEARSTRENETGRLQLLGNFRGAEEENVTTQEQATASARYNLNLTAPWSLSSQFRADYDRFQDYDWEWSATTGPGYQIRKTPSTDWLAFAGIGASQKVGAIDDDGVKPVLNLGTEYTKEFSQGNVLAINFNAFPYLDNAGEYRLVSKVEWTHSLVETLGLDLRLGIEDRYDSQPGSGQKNNDMEYYGSFVKSW
jgi:putative salt-induced outer membrane protein YdiY